MSELESGSARRTSKQVRTSRRKGGGGGIADFLKYVGYCKKRVKTRGWDRMGIVGGGGDGD